MSSGHGGALQPEFLGLGLQCHQRVIVCGFIPKQTEFSQSRMMAAKGGPGLPPQWVP